MRLLFLCLLLQYLVQSCSRGGSGIVEDMCYERRGLVCVFITAGPTIKLCALCGGGRGTVKGTSLPITHVTVITAVVV